MKTRHAAEDISHIPPTVLREKEEEIEISENQEEMQTLDQVQSSTNKQKTQTSKTIRMTGICLVNTASGFEIPIPLEGGILGRSGTINRTIFKIAGLLVMSMQKLF